MGWLVGRERKGGVHADGKKVADHRPVSWLPSPSVPSAMNGARKSQNLPWDGIVTATKQDNTTSECGMCRAPRTDQGRRTHQRPRIPTCVCCWCVRTRRLTTSTVVAHHCNAAPTGEPIPDIIVDAVHLLPDVTTQSGQWTYRPSPRAMSKLGL